MIKKITLKNGLEVVAIPMPSMKSVACGVWARCGGRYENKINSGISHFIEHLLFKGTKKRDGKNIKETIEGIGGSFNGFTSEEFTCYLVKLLGNHVDIAVDVLADMVSNPRFAESDIEKERTVIIEEIKMYLDQPMQYVHEILGELMWPANPLGMPLAGTFDTVNSITKNDIIDFKNKFYNSRNIIVAFAGNIDIEKIAKLVEKNLRLPSGKSINCYEKITKNEIGPRLKVLTKDTEQLHLAIGLHGLSRQNKERYSASLLNIILGANMSSRLFQEVREKRGLAYEISSHNKSYNDTGAFVISAGVDIKKSKDAIRIILKELSRIKKEHVKKDEFRRAKEYYKGQVLMALEDTTTSMLWVGEKISAEDKLTDINKILKIVDEITTEDIKKVANMIFKNVNLNMSIIGPVKESDIISTLNIE